MKITYYVHDLSFPVVEGVRKQAWWMAQEMQKQGHNVTILSTGHKKRKITKGGITIIYGNPVQIALEAPKADVMHYISHPSPLLLPLLLLVNARRQIMTLFDGNLNGFWKRGWDILLSKVVKRNVSLLTVQTEHQRRILQKTRVRDLNTTVIPPLIPHFTSSAEKSTQPTLLFMSHLSAFKGIGEVLRAFEIVRENIPNIKLVICDSGIRKNNKYYQYINRINRGDIILKGKVNPEEELSKAWIYLYPVQTSQETFSVPLSLIEAHQIGTPFISTDVGGIAEYFPHSHLIERGNATQLADKIRDYIKHKKEMPSIQKIDNGDVIEKWTKMYHQ